MTMSKAIARAWAEDAYKAKLLNDPHAALAEAGIEIPAGTTIKVIENTADTQHIILPVAPADAGALSIEELEKIAGGVDAEAPAMAMGSIYQTMSHSTGI